MSYSFSEPLFHLVTPQCFRIAAALMLLKAPGLHMYEDNRRNRAMFVVRYDACADGFNRLLGSIPPRGKIRHLFWALVLLKVYAIEDVHCTIKGTNGATLRKCSWTYIYLPYVWNNLF